MALRLARASAQLARRAARGRPVLPRHGDPRPWLLASVLGSPAAVGGRRDFCSVRHFAGESSAAAVSSEDDEPEDGFANGDRVCAWFSICKLQSLLSVVLCVRMFTYAESFFHKRNYSESNHVIIPLVEFLCSYVDLEGPLIILRIRTILRQHALNNASERLIWYSLKGTYPTFRVVSLLSLVSSSNTAFTAASCVHVWTHLLEASRVSS